jgi:hypothetical protein
MTPFATSADSSREPGFAPVDDLDRLELRIARRADELNTCFGAHGRDLEHWLQAEREIIASGKTPEPTAV